MDLMKSDYEFLDLSDVKEAELNSLQSALYEHIPDVSAAALADDISEPTIDPWSSSSSTAGAPTVSSSVDSVSGGEGEMAPHSPARGPPAHVPPPYAQPPPAYPPPHHQWPVAPPNVYVSQVTANVNVHGYMGQYYQPPQQYAPPERSRPQRRERRGKRAPSPPPPPPYYLQYPQYYPAAQAQGAPLYQFPVYQPLVYGPYAYPPYYPEYPMPVEGEADKGPEEYPPEVVMEQEAVDAYYAGAHYAPQYVPPVEAGVEYMPPVYLPPPQHMPPLHAPPPMPTPHQFNVHAKNFVQGQSQAKTYAAPPEKAPDLKTPTASAAAPAVAGSVEALPMKDLKVSKGPGSPKQTERSPEVGQAKVPSPGEKPAPSPKTESPKAWNSGEVKTDAPPILSAKTFPAIVPVPSAQGTVAKLPPTGGKSTKGPAAPFSSKQPPKPSIVPSAVPTLQPVSTPKAPFGSRQRREPLATRSPSADTGEERPAPPVEHVKREPPLPPSKAPMPISITLHAAGPPVIVANKPPFGHSRKGAVAPEPAPAPAPPPPAPTASDFPPPPTPRNRGEPAPPPVVAPQPPAAPGKSWASLFSNKAASGPAPTPAPVTPAAPAPPVAVEEPPVAIPPVAPNVQKPVAKVPPFDASPLQTSAGNKSPAPVLSYSEKTSASVVRPTAEVSIAKEPASPAPAAPTPSPFTDDPNSYRMGEFLTKYQLDNRPASLLPRGLTNRSNYCYVNAILQALIACPPFYNMLKALPYQTRRGKSSTPVIDSMVELCYEFSGTGCGNCSTGRRGPTPLGALAGPALDPGAALRVLRALRPFAGSQEARQEDAEEFLGCLLNSLNDEMLELMKLVEPEDSSNGTAGSGAGATSSDDDEWKVMGPRNRGAVERRWAARRTPVADIFRGRTRLRLTRAPPADVTDRVQPFFTLQLDIERANSVKDALELLAGKDSLEGVNDAWQQLSIEQLPVVLLLHLKCFQLDTEGHTAKIVKNIDFPIDLKIDPKIMSSKLKYTTKQRVYKLFAVVYHEGVEAVKGHYLTDTFHNQVGWIRYDDATVTQVNEAHVLKPKSPRMPYLLMYRRHDTLPPRKTE